MAKQEKKELLPTSKFKKEHEDAIAARIKNTDFASAAVNAIGDKKVAECEELAYDATIAAMSTLDALKLKHEKLVAKGDLGMNTLAKGSAADFSRKEVFSDEKAKLITEVVSAYNTLSAKFDHAIEAKDEGKDPWNAVLAAVKVGKKLLDNESGQK